MDIPSTWRDTTDDICPRPRQGLVVGDPDTPDPDEQGRKTCLQCRKSKIRSTGFYHRDVTTDDGFADICKICRDPRVHRKGGKAYFMETFALQEGWDSLPDMIRQLWPIHHSCRALACAIGVGVMTPQRHIYRSKIRDYAEANGYHGIEAMLRDMVRRHGYPRPIAKIIGVSETRIGQACAQWGIELKDGRNVRHRAMEK